MFDYSRQARADARAAVPAMRVTAADIAAALAGLPPGGNGTDGTGGEGGEQAAFMAAASGAMDPLNRAVAPGGFGGGPAAEAWNAFAALGAPGAEDGFGAAPEPMPALPGGPAGGPAGFSGGAPAAMPAFPADPMEFEVADGGFAAPPVEGVAEAWEAFASAVGAPIESGGVSSVFRDHGRGLSGGAMPDAPDRAGDKRSPAAESPGSGRRDITDRLDRMVIRRAIEIGRRTQGDRGVLKERGQTFNLREDGACCILLGGIQAGTDDRIPAVGNKGSIAWLHSHPPKPRGGNPARKDEDRLSKVAALSDKDRLVIRIIRRRSGRDPYAYLITGDGAVHRFDPGRYRRAARIAPPGTVKFERNERVR